MKANGDGAFTEIIPLGTGCIPWDSPHNMNSILINMLPDINGRLLSLPVFKSLYTFTDESGTGLEYPVTILAILRANKSVGEYDDKSHANTYHSDYVIITTKYYALPGPVPIVLTFISIDENTHNIIDSSVIAGGDEGVTLEPNFINRGKFSYAQNSINQCAFIDDVGLLYSFTLVGEHQGAQRGITYSTSRAWYEGGISNAGQWGIIGTLGSGAVQQTSTDGTINYQRLLDRTLNKQLLVCTILDYGLIYNETQNVLFLTEAGNFSRMQWVNEQWPIFSGTQESPGDLIQPGTPIVFKAPGKIIDMFSIGASLYIFTQDMILKYNLTIVSGNPTLQQDMSFYQKFGIRLNSSALLFQNAAYFITQDEKLYSLSQKNIITELTNRILPDQYYFKFNTYLKNNVPQEFFQSRLLFGAKILGMSCLINSYMFYNLETQAGTFAYYLPNINTNFSWVPFPSTDNYNYNQPSRITAVSEDGQYIGLQNKLLYSPPTFDNTISDSGANPDLFSCQVFFTKQYPFDGSDIGALVGIDILLRDANLDPSSLSSFNQFTIGLYVVKDAVFDQALINNLSSDTWWSAHNVTFNRKFATNAFYTRLNIPCKSFILCFRFGKYSDTGSEPKFRLQKSSIENIMANILK